MNDNRPVYVTQPFLPPLEVFIPYLEEIWKNKKKRMAIIASKGTLDMAYPPVILASTAAAMDVEVGIFFTL